MLDSNTAGTTEGTTLRRLFGLFSPGRIILLAVLAAAIYLGFSAGNNLLHSYHLAGDESRLREEVAGLSGQEEQLQQIRDYLRTDEYVEFMARRVLGLVKPGEILVVVDAPESEEAQKEDPSSLTWWQRLFGQ
jgi:cell division protein FtsB